MKNNRLSFAWKLTILSIGAMLPAIGCNYSDSGDYREIVDSMTDEDSAAPASSTPETSDAPAGGAETTTDADASQADSPKSGKPLVADAGTGTDATGTQLLDAATDSEPATRTPAESAKDGTTGPVDADSNPAATVQGERTTPTTEATADNVEPKLPTKTVVKPNEVKLLIPTRDFKVEGPENAIRVSFDDVDLLKVINMEPVVETAPKLLPKWLKAIDGKRIRLRGFMYPPFESEGLRGFVLARDNEICCFGRNPKVYDLVTVVMRDGQTTNYIEGRPFDVVGDFHIGDTIEPGELFWIDNAVVMDRN